MSDQTTAIDDQTFTELQRQHQAAGAAGAIEHLIATLRERKQYHPLFDALLMKKRQEMGVPLTRPASFDTIPPERRDEFEQSYIAAAREVGELFLKDGSIAQAWLYLNTIREPQKVADAINALPPDQQAEEEIIEIAFFKGVSPVHGVRLLLASHGTCSTITSLDQQMNQFSPEVRAQCAAVMVRNLYDSLRDTLQGEVQRRQPMTAPGQSIRELIATRDWLFTDDNYHIDVSHLNSVVRFARSLSADAPELALALQLAQYGARLSPQYQYAGSPPFEDFYPAHIEYFKALLNDNREQALSYFREKLTGDADSSETQLSALALVDLLQKLHLDGEALDVACKHLARTGEEYGFSLSDLCVQSGRFDLLRDIAREQGDVIGYTAALVHAGA